MELKNDTKITIKMQIIGKGLGCSDYTTEKTSVLLEDLKDGTGKTKLLEWLKDITDRDMVSYDAGLDMVTEIPFGDITQEEKENIETCISMLTSINSPRIARNIFFVDNTLKVVNRGTTYSPSFIGKVIIATKLAIELTEIDDIEKPKAKQFLLGIDTISLNYALEFYSRVTSRNLNAPLIKLSKIDLNDTDIDYNDRYSEKGLNSKYNLPNEFYEKVELMVHKNVSQKLKDKYLFDYLIVKTLKDIKAKNVEDRNETEKFLMRFVK